MVTRDIVGDTDLTAPSGMLVLCTAEAAWTGLSHVDIRQVNHGTLGWYETSRCSLYELVINEGVCRLLHAAKSRFS